MSAEPAPLPGVRAARTLYAALYGEFVPHPRPAFSQDAYSLFYARSAAMGWLTPAREGELGGLWGMNDAEAGAFAFFQVTLTEPAEGTLLPVQPFLDCADAVMARLGTLRLDAVKLLPEHDADADARFASPASMRTSRALQDALNWFGEGGDHHRVTFRGTLAEWSLDALGWVAAFLADLSARHGVRTPLILTADRLT